MGIKESDMPSIVLTKEEHKKFTEAWKKAIGYENSGSSLVTGNVNREEILNAARNIYKDYPELLNMLNVDLLIIDDLGTEKISDSKITELFTIINTRLLNQNHKITKTIISTNLNVDELFKTYTTRIGSRLAGNYRFLRFFGDDLRFKKSKKEA